MDLSLQGRPSCSNQLDRQVAAASRRFPAVRSGEGLLERRAATPSPPTARSKRAPQQVAPWVIRAAQAMVRGVDGGGSRRLCKEQATRLAPKLRGDVLGGREVNRRLPGLLWQAPIAANASDFGAQPEPGLLSDEPMELLGALARVLNPLRGGRACAPVSVAILALVRPHKPPKLAVGVEGEIQRGAQGLELLADDCGRSRLFLKYRA